MMRYNSSEQHWFFMLNHKIQVPLDNATAALTIHWFVCIVRMDIHTQLLGGLSAVQLTQI